MFTIQNITNECNPKKLIYKYATEQELHNQLFEYLPQNNIHNTLQLH